MFTKLIELKPTYVSLVFISQLHELKNDIVLADLLTHFRGLFS